MGFEPTIPPSERAKTVQALDRSATVTGKECLTYEKMKNTDSRLALTNGTI
jgi:hypothetical protein